MSFEQDAYRVERNNRAAVNISGRRAGIINIGLPSGVCLE